MSLREISLFVCGLLAATKAQSDYLLICDIEQKRVFKMPLKTSSSDVDSITELPLNDKTNIRIYAAAVGMRNGEVAWEDLYNRKLMWGDKSIAYDEYAVSIAITCCGERIFWSHYEKILTWDGNSWSYETIYNSPKSMDDAEVRQLTVDCLKKRIYWVEHHISLRHSKVMRADYNGKNVETVLTYLAETNGMAIDYETYTLYIMTVATKTLYALPLKELENSIPSTSPTFRSYKKTVLTTYLRGNLFMDIVVKDGYVYIGGFNTLPIQRYKISSGPKSIESYGSTEFQRISSLDFYDDKYFDKHINTTCPKTSSACRLESTAYIPTVVAYIVFIARHVMAS